MSKQQTREAFDPARAAAIDPSSFRPETAPAGNLPVAAAPAAGPPALAGGGADNISLTPHIDAHGFDPADYKWVPVRRRPRKDGWSEAKQRLFIEVLADTACVDQAARAVGLSVQSAYALRRAPGGEAFAAAWGAAVQQGALKLVDVAFDRAIHGSDEPVFDRDGCRVGRRMRQNDRLLMFLLRAHLPERYAHAHRGTRPAAAGDPPSTPPLAEAIARLEPAAPPDLHVLMPPRELAVALRVADLLEGELPRCYRPEAPDEESFDAAPLGADFERGLAEAKEAADTPDLDACYDDDADWLDEDDWDEEDCQEDEDDRLDNEDDDREGVPDPAPKRSLA